MRLLLPLLLACAPAPEAPADTGDARRCGRPRCVSVTEPCRSEPGEVCSCTTVTCRDRCGATVVEGEPVCRIPVPIVLHAPRG